jgi:hypothetical protein
MPHDASMRQLGREHTLSSQHDPDDVESPMTRASAS